MRNPAETGRLPLLRRVAGAAVLGAVLSVGAGAAHVEAVSPSPTPVLSESVPVNTEDNNWAPILLTGLLTIGAIFKVKEIVDDNRLANNPNAEAVMKERLNGTVFLRR